MIEPRFSEPPKGEREILLLVPMGEHPAGTIRVIDAARAERFVAAGYASYVVKEQPRRRK